MIRTPPGKDSIDGASRFRFSLVTGAYPVPGTRQQNDPGTFFCLQVNFSSICGRLGRPPFFPFSLAARLLAGEVTPLLAFPPKCDQTRRMSFGVIGIVAVGSFLSSCAFICAVFAIATAGCQPVFPILHLGEYEHLYQGAPALPPPPTGGWGQGPAPDPLTVPASVPVKSPSPPHPRRDLAMNANRGGFATKGEGLEIGPYGLHVPRRRVFNWGYTPSPPEGLRPSYDGF